MTAYLLLLVFIYLIYFISRFSFRGKEASKRFFLFFSFFAIFLLCVLRDYSVGRDISTYIDVYERSKLYPFADTSWTHMEVGYIVFMQLCSYIGLSSRLFICVVYFLMLFPIYNTFRKYSHEALLSVIIYVCFQFLTFDMSGIRQGLAISFCLLCLPYIKLSSKKDFILFVLLLLLAYTFHHSSIIFILAPLVIRLNINLRNIFIFLLLFILAPTLTNIVMTINIENELSKYTFDDRLSMVGILLFLFIIIMFIFLTCVKLNIRKSLLGKSGFSLVQYLFLLATCLFFMLAFNGTMLSRSTMCYSIIMTIAIPNTIKKYDQALQTILNIVFHLFLLLFFYQFCLAPRALDTVPYKLGMDLIFKNI